MPTKDINKLRAYRKKWYRNNKEKQKTRKKERTREIREWWYSFKSTLQCSCGESHVACIELHHREKKSFELSYAIKNGYSREKIMEEVSKCEVLCANCHRKRHWVEGNCGLEFKSDFKIDD